MKKLIFSCVALIVIMSSCRTLTSNTVIKAKESFILGNNQHGAYSVKLRNVSNKEISVHQAPLSGGEHSFMVVKPYQWATVSVESNTALIVDNKSDSVISVDLKVYNSFGSLSMGYKN